MVLNSVVVSLVKIHLKSKWNWINFYISTNIVLILLYSYSLNYHLIEHQLSSLIQSISQGP